MGTKSGRRCSAPGLLLLALMLAFLLLGCGSSSGGADAPDSLHAIKMPYAPHITTTYDSSNAGAIRQLYDTIRALPPYQSAAGSCPLARSLKWHLEFRRGDTSVLVATADIGGCVVVGIGTNDVRQMSSGFWSQLAAALGVPVSVVTTPQPYTPTPEAAIVPGQGTF